ncbi:HNS family histone-like protein [Pseudooceanicola batsensis HTCC2597]|uniref:HNS family histone-like protein n=1 Tax=Pseudooceanicola batsensis (strain ATCC BAA-863 / DSM 15984 / KCTC 12145 / HTCC2597) TaxID=252305 RepID=A3U3K4_PSEBH|nr:H-NS histone family protein [Pseudooceanicola batsensis]EAQ01206.1 HNS family histone-like protein [Pseudooceanicola batsensis HTCC2597]
MANIDLNSMDLSELKSLRKDVDAAIKTFEDRKKKAALAELEAKAAEMGFSLNDLTGSGGGRGRKVNPPKYRHPENDALTWSGRGRQPDWYKEQVSKGTAPEDLLIVKPR